MVVNLIFKNSKTLKIRRVKTEVDEPNLFSFLVNIRYLTSTITTIEKKEEYLIGITDKDPIS